MDGHSFAREREELGWYFAGLGPTIGLAAARLEPGGQRIFDDHASKQAHLRRRGHQHRSDMIKLATVEGTLAITGTRQTLSEAFTPFGSGRATWRAITAFMADGLSLFGMAVASQATFRLWHSRGRELGIACGQEPTLTERIALIEHEVGGLRGNRITTGHRLMTVYQECISSLDSALGFYAVGRAKVRAARLEQRARDNAMRLEQAQREMNGG